MVATGIHALRLDHPGIDMLNNEWATLRGLLRGDNTYDPTNLAYRHRYGVHDPSALYVPSSLLLHAPLAALSKSAAAAAMALLETALLWVGVLLFVRPRSRRDLVIAGSVGVVLTLTTTMQDLTYTGQLSAWALVGLALLAGHRASASPWWPALGVALVSLKPQSAIPIFVALALLRWWPVLVRAAAIVSVASVPGLVLFWRAAGVSGMVHTIRPNLAHFERTPAVDLRDFTNNRIDLAGVISHLHGPKLYGLGAAMLVALFVSTVVAVPLRRAGADQVTGRPVSPVVVSVLALFVVLPLYHQPYDGLLLFAGPLAALGSLRRRWRPLYVGGAALLVVELAFRVSLQSRWVDLGFASRDVRAAYFTIPTLVAIAFTAAAARRLPAE